MMANRVIEETPDKRSGWGGHLPNPRRSLHYSVLLANAKGKLSGGSEVGKERIGSGMPLASASRE